MVTPLNANRRKNWVDLHNLRIIKYGSTLHLDAHLTVPWYLNVHEAHTEIDELALLVRSEFGESLELFVHSDGCTGFNAESAAKMIARCGNMHLKNELAGPLRTFRPIKSITFQRPNEKDLPAPAHYSCCLTG